MSLENQLGPHGTHRLPEHLNNETQPFLKPEDVRSYDHNPAIEIEGTLDNLPAQLVDPEEEVISERPITSSDRLIGGANESKVIHLENDGMAVFKPSSGESDSLRYNTPSGTYFLRERAAYLVSQVVDFDIVPPTVIREVEGEIGSAQDFVENGTVAMVADFSFKDHKYHSDLAKMWLLDQMIWNSDRHPGNYMITDSAVKAIDHGLSFGDDGVRTEGDFYFVDKELPIQVLDKLKSFDEWPEGYEVLSYVLSPLLPAGEVDACIKRVRAIVKTVLSTGRLERKVNFMGDFNEVEMEDVWAAL